MTAASLNDRGGGSFALSGELGFDNVPELWETSLAAFRPHEGLHIDLQGVTASNSAGLALLLEWTRLAHAEGKAIRFSGLPSQMRAVMAVSDLDGVLPID